MRSARASALLSPGRRLSYHHRQAPGQTLKRLPGRAKRAHGPSARCRIRIPDPALEALRAHGAAPNRASAFGFVNGAGTPIPPRGLVKVLQGRLAKAGLPEFRFHALHHLCATLHRMAGTNPAVVAEILGHSTVVLTPNTYSPILTPVQDEAAERMGQRLLSQRDANPTRR